MKDNPLNIIRRKWFTCTPVAFKGDHTFFNRDSGLFCKAFQEIGVESKAVMPLPSQEGDWPDLIRTAYKNLESAEWWRSQHIDGVILYAWTKTCYTPIARAIHNSGTKLVLYLDVGALTYPWKDWMFGSKLIFRSNRIKHPFFWPPISVIEIIRANTLKPLNAIRRRKHIDYADIIGIPSPPAIEAYKRIPFLFSKKSRSAISLMPAPVASHFTYNPNIQKEDRIIAVGRWSDEDTKRPRFLMQALNLFTKENRTTKIDVFGHVPDFMLRWHNTLYAEVQSRIHLHGSVNSVQLACWFQKASICLCPSIRESTHLVSAEAVCCGCSIVASPSPGQRTVHWYASHESGTIAKSDTPEGFAQAMSFEISDWKRGDRDASKISAHWINLLRASNTARRICSSAKMGTLEIIH